MPPRALSRKRRPAKRRSFKRKSRKGTHKRRRMSVVRRKRFPMARTMTRFSNFARHREDQVLMRMTAHREYYLSTAVIGAVDPNVGMSGWIALQINNLSTACLNSDSTVTVTGQYVDPAGMNEMMDTYTYYQVRGCKTMFEFSQDGLVAATTRPIEVCVAPMSPGIYTGFDGASISAQPFNQLASQPKAKRAQLIGDSAFVVQGIDKMCRITLFDSPHKIAASPMYYGGEGTVGEVTTPPTDTPRFVLAWCCTGPSTTTPMTFRVRMVCTYSVLFYGRAYVPFTAPKPVIPISTPVTEDEKMFDEIPEYVRVQEPPSTPSREFKELKISSSPAPTPRPFPPAPPRAPAKR